MKEKQCVYFEELKPLTQEIIIDLIVSIIETKKIQKGKEGEEDE